MRLSSYQTLKQNNRFGYLFVVNLYRCRVVAHLGWNDYHFGLSTFRLFLPGRGEFDRIGWVAVHDGRTSKSKSTQARYTTTGVPLFNNFIYHKVFW